ncbi:uncharacterized protein [Struthio camelus]|uniref:uncharacterized protein n=1 Tax=Struthio camelus TaxID=8801 RepID=UPI0036040924
MARAGGASAPARRLLLLLLLLPLPLLPLPLAASRARGAGAARQGARGPDGQAFMAYPSLDGRPISERRQDPQGSTYLSSERGRIFEHRRGSLDVPVGRAHPSSERDPVSERWQDLQETTVMEKEKETLQEGPSDSLPVAAGEKEQNEAQRPPGVDSEKGGALHNNTQMIYITALSVVVTGFILTVIHSLVLYRRIRKQERVLPLTGSVYKTEYQNRAESRRR